MLPALVPIAVVLVVMLPALVPIEVVLVVMLPALVETLAARAPPSDVRLPLASVVTSPPVENPAKV
jgi:hypothetical protein